MATKYKTRAEQRRRRHMRVRRKIFGTAERPRMAVCRTTKHLYVQFIDDDAGRTLAAASTVDKALRDQNVKANMAGAEVIGKAAAERLTANGISQVVFDRGGMPYHGLIKAVADSARQAGLKF